MHMRFILFLTTFLFSCEVINNEEDEKELFEKYIDNGLVNPDNVPPLFPV